MENLEYAFFTWICLFIPKLKFLLRGLKRPVLDVLFCWLNNNYGKKNVLAKQKSQDTFSLKEKVNSKSVITTQQIADQLNTTKDVILLYAEQVLPNKEIKHGITTYWTEEETTLILGYALFIPKLP